MQSRSPLHVDVLRDAVVESQHQVVVSVANHQGRVVGGAGHPDFLVYPRSTIKMLQTIPFVESGAAQAFDLDDRMIALASSSHRGEKNHIALLDEWMKKTDIAETCMVCGGHLPFEESAHKEIYVKNVPLTQKFHNCAGKHLGLLSTCKHLNLPMETYQSPDHPMQKQLKQILSESTQFDYEKAYLGIDGCGIPTYALPLKHLAIGMSVFIQEKISEVRKKTCEKILLSCQKHPFLLSGEKSFVSLANHITSGRVILKNGAEGSMCGLLVEKKLAFALKASDGAARAAEAATLQLLKLYGAVTEEEFSQLKPFALPDLKNSRGEIVGGLRVAVESR